MTIEYQLTLDCADPGRLVTFWASALGYIPKPAPDGFVTWRDDYLSINIPAEELGDGNCTDRLIDPAGRAPGIWFQPVPEGRSSRTGCTWTCSSAAAVPYRWRSGANASAPRWPHRPGPARRSCTPTTPHSTITTPCCCRTRRATSSALCDGNRVSSTRR